MVHDFKRYPELTNSQLQFYYFDSPHKQITEDFRARVVKVTDGDTIRVECDFRDFSFPVRFAALAAPELDEFGGLESQRWLHSQIMGKDVDIILSKKRVEKWGRLLADVICFGMNMSEASAAAGHGIEWSQRGHDIWS